MPAILIEIISSDRINFKNKPIEEIKKINGNNLYIILGTFKKHNDNGNHNPTSWSLKKFISSNKLRMRPNDKKIKVIFNMFFEYSIKKYFLNVFDLNILIF